ncbi:MAG: histidine kinase dimerization/phospho-acceptor domain-containing protein, partial [Anaerolineae bacterium]|nr:histidine kinase dimerization/phospho-acceptor domain-containing protein [Anaerolineae bacterium]
MVKTIRQKAEAVLREQYPIESLIEDKDLPEILHELRVHQVELELQNDELQRTQEDLRTTQKKYFELYNFAPVGYFTLNRRGVIKDLNHTGAELLGRDRRRLLNQPLISHLHADSRLVFFDYLDVLFNTKMQQSCELTLETMQKRITHVQVEGIVDRDQKECRIIMTNISPLKTVKTALEKERSSLAERVEKRTAELTKANEKLIRASRHKDEFLANMSHELRTPLQAILSGVEMLEGQLYGTLNSKQLEMLRRVERGGNHLLRLITDILDL